MRSLHIALLLTCSLLLFGIKASPAQANPLLTWDVYPETYPSGACPSPTPLPYQFTSEGIFVDVNSCASKVFIVTTAYNGLSLADITALNFTMSTDPTATNPRNFYVNVYVDQTGTGANHTHRLDFAPPNGTSVANLFTDPYWRINGAVPSRNWADTLTALGGNPRIAPAPWNDPAAAAFRVSTGDTGTNYVGHKGTFSAFTIVAPASNINDSFDFANLGAISGDACGNPPNRGALQITQSTVGYQSPAGGIIRLANGAPLEVFNDAGGDGFDEFIIARSAVVDDVTWYGLFLGSCDLVWVPETAGTRVR